MIEVLGGLVELAQSPIRHPERIVDGHHLGVQGQGRRQMVHGALVVALHQCGSTEFDADSRLAGIDRPCLGEALLGVVGPRQIEVDASQPDQRREISGAQEPGAFERVGRARHVAVVPCVEQVRQRGLA